MQCIDVGNVVCSFVLMPPGSMVFRVWIQYVSLLRSAMLSALGRWSIAVICRLLMLCPGELKCLATG